MRDREPASEGRAKWKGGGAIGQGMGPPENRGAGGPATIDWRARFRPLDPTHGLVPGPWLATPLSGRSVPLIRTPSSPRAMLRTLGLLGLVLLSSCVDGVVDGFGGRASRVPLSMSPVFPVGFAVGEVSRIRLKLVRVPGGEVVATVVRDVDPAASSWDLTVEVEWSGGGALSVQGEVELIRVEGGSEVVTWSGRTPVLSVIPGQRVEAGEVPLGRGGLENLGVRSVELPAGPLRLIRGRSAQVAAVVSRTDGSTGGQVTWESLSPDVVGVDAQGGVTALKAGEGRIRASAGFASATLDVRVAELLELRTERLEAGFAGRPYRSVVEWVGGDPPQGVSLAGGALPDGVTLSPAGVLSGTPSAPGRFSPVIRVSSADGQSVERTFELLVTEVLAVAKSELRAGIVGFQYEDRLEARGGVAPYGWSLVSGALPAGLTLSGTGVVSGIPSAAGVGTARVRVASSDGQSAEVDLAVQVGSQLRIRTTTLPPAPEGKAYRVQLEAEGGSGGYTWALLSGTLPDGLSLSGSGVISGTATGAGTQFRVGVTAGDGQTANVELGLAVRTPLEMTTTLLARQIRGIQFSETLRATGGEPPLRWSLASGAWPSGVTLSETGVLSGTATEAGTFRVEVAVRSADGQEVKRGLVLQVSEVLSIGTTALPAGVEGTGYSVQLVATGGAAPYTWRLVSGALPSGLSLSPSGLLSGTPATGVSGMLEVEVSAADGQRATKMLALSIEGLGIDLEIVEVPLPGEGLLGDPEGGAGEGDDFIGDTLKLPIGVRNNSGTQATGVRVQLELPPYYRFVQGFGESYDEGTGIWDVGTVAPGDTVTLGVDWRIGTDSIFAVVDSTYAGRVFVLGANEELTNPGNDTLRGEGTLRRPPAIRLHCEYGSAPPAGSPLSTPMAASDIGSSLCAQEYGYETTDLPGTRIGEEYSYPFVADYGTQDAQGNRVYEWSVIGGGPDVSGGGASGVPFSSVLGPWRNAGPGDFLPEGLALDPQTGQLSGVVNPSVAPGLWSVQVQVRSGRGVGMETFFLYIQRAPSLSLTTTTLPIGAVGIGYSQPLGSSGGAGTRSWTATGLPPGLSLDGSSGVISGTPTTAGSFPVLFRVESQDGQLAETTLALNIVSSSPAPGAVGLLSTGGSHTCHLAPSGTTTCWGFNPDGRLGDGTTTNRNVPTPVAGGGVYAALSAGNVATCALTGTGAFSCWGSDQYGTLGDGAVDGSRTTPSTPSGGPFTAISTTLHACALDGAGQAFCWGGNTYGQVGNGSTTAADAPVAVATALRFSDISSGQFHSCALTAEGVAWCWGRNDSGQLGVSGTGDRLTPVQVSTALRFTRIASGYSHTCALDLESRAWCWGRGAEGQLGYGSTAGSIAPVSVGRGMAFAHLSTFAFFNCGVDAGGNGWCWGRNDDGQLGDGTLTTRSLPVPVAGAPHAFSRIESGVSHTCAVKTNETVWCWGSNSVGQLGNGTTTASTTPVPVSFPVNVPAIQTASLPNGLVGAPYTATLTASGGTPGYIWEVVYPDESDSASEPLPPGLSLSASSGEILGTPTQSGTTQHTLRVIDSQGLSSTRKLTLTIAPAPTLVITTESLPDATPQLEYFAQLSAQGSEGTLTWSVVDDPENPLDAPLPEWIALNATTGALSGVAPSVGGETTVHTIQVSDGPISTRKTFFLTVLAGGLGTPAPAWVDVAAGEWHSCGILNDGTAWCWGDNLEGQLGDGTTVSSAAPREVLLPGVTFTQIEAGLRHTCALDETGSAWCWGYNEFGRTGIAPVSPWIVSSPVQVQTTEALVSIAAGASHSCAVTAGGQGICWGANDWGALGDGTQVSSHVPVVVSGSSGFTQIAAGFRYSCARTAEGQIYCWGLNSWGQLGDGTINTSPLPVLAGTTGPFERVVAGDSHTCGVADTGAAWCWGNNGSGRLGDGTTDLRLTPAAVAAALQFTSIDAGTEFTCGIGSDSAARCWGANFVGQLGTGGVPLISSVPVTVSGGMLWTKVATGTSHSCGISAAEAEMWCWGQSGAKLGTQIIGNQTIPVYVPFPSSPVAAAQPSRSPSR